MAAIPRGIMAISRKNADKSISIRYRIRQKKTEFNIDRYFDDLETAKLFLEDTKTPEGRLAILQGRDKATLRPALIQATVDDILANGRITLGNAIDSYIRKFIEPKISSKIDKVQRTAKVNKSRLTVCKRILVGRIKPGHLVPSGAYAILKDKSKGWEEVAIGSMFIDEMNEEHTTGYILARQGDDIANSTIKREIGAMQSCINSLIHTDNKAHRALNGYNPFTKAKKELLKGGTKRRRRVITEDEEEKLLALMRKLRNKEVPIIFALGLETGMRRAELLAIRWDQVDLEGYTIDLDPEQAKSGEERLISLSDEAVEALKILPKKDERLFHYKIEGWKTVWRRLVKGSGIENIVFHDLRRTCISRMLIETTGNSVAIAAMLGAKSVRSIENSTINPVKQAQAARRRGVRSQQEIKDMVGHSSDDMNLSYANIQGLKKK